MPRRVQDIIPSDRRSIRNVPLDAREEKNAAPKSSTKEKIQPIPIKILPADPVPPPRKRAPKRKGGTWLMITLGIIILIAGAGYIASAYFSRATFTLVPKSIPITVDSTYITQSIAGNGALVYQLIPVEASTSAIVPALAGPSVSTKAQGTVTLYNAYSTQPQRLIAGTRMSNDSGLVYRLTSSVVIPGETSGGSPGSLQAAIVADQPGQQYNISDSDAVSEFKMVAYQGGPRYDAIYAQLASDVTGGFVGAQKVVDPAVVASTTATLQSNLTATLAARAQSLIPAGSIMYDGAYVTSFSNPLIGGTGSSTATVTLQGTLYAITFKEADLISQLAGPGASTLFGDFPYTAPGLDALTFSILNAADFSPVKKGPLIIHLKGNVQLVGTIPVAEIKNKLLGVPLADTQVLLKPYSAVMESGSGELVPPWSNVPSDPNRVTIVVQTP